MIPTMPSVDKLLSRLEQQEALPEDLRNQVLDEKEAIVVALIHAMISDRPGFIEVAKHWLTASDFQLLQSLIIGSGKIGGKAGGLLLAWKILRWAAPQAAEQVVVPRSRYIGADTYDDFLARNKLEYRGHGERSLERIREEYPKIQSAYLRGRFPEEILERLQDLIREAGDTPWIVRSSGLLEDSFGMAFAGKYLSVFCPNQGSAEENLRDLTAAVRRVYASVYSPDAMIYRRKMGLTDAEERMALLLQEVQGQTYREFHFPPLAGVAYSYSPIVWNARLRREEGFCRLVMGLGTRAVDRVAEDFPRLVTLSHPNLRPETTPAEIRRYSQKSVDVIDRKMKALRTVPASALLERDFPALPWLASVDRGDVITPLVSLGARHEPERMVLTFDAFLQRTEFIPLLREILSTLAREYHLPVDVEFAVTVDPQSPKRNITFHLLQCRAQAGIRGAGGVKLPKGMREDDKFFVATRLVPQGVVQRVEYICYVDPGIYGGLPDSGKRREVATIVGRLNKALEGRTYILIGPGRWGSIDPLLGVPVTYADICNTRVLVELAQEQQGVMSEPSYGTHFFQDLVEAEIYPVAVHSDLSGDLFCMEWLDRAANRLKNFLPDLSPREERVKLIDVPGEFGGRKLDIVMDGETAVAFLAAEGERRSEKSRHGREPSE
jgi:hypothetical protein